MTEQHPHKTVVVGCDGSWHSHRAVTAATHEAVRRSDELLVLVVPDLHELHSDRLGEMARSERDARARASGTASMGLAWAREADRTVRARAVVLPLDSPDLASLLQETGLLVLGGHGRGGQRAFSLGSTSQQLAHGCAAPLLVTAPDGALGRDPGQTEVVVGLDGQPWSRHALAYAVEQAVGRATTLVVVHAVLPRQPHVATAVARATRDIAAALDSAPAGLSKVKVLVTVAPVVDAVLQACGPTSLLVLGNRGPGRVQGPVPGSLTQKLLEAAACDVVLVPAPLRGESAVSGASAVAEPV
jgi:nucleotide-binding universal stress UspA family protein